MTKQRQLFQFFFLLFFILLPVGCSSEGDVTDEGEGPGIKHSPYLTHVFEYMPAPGQFVNKLPEYKEGDTFETMAKKAEEKIAGDRGGLISLGGFGGYVVVGFDHTIENVPGKADFAVLGNAYAGNSEPGIVMVSADINKNGKPDDPWYELAGSEHDNEKTIQNYEITYYRPDENKTPVPHPSLFYVTDAAYIKWTANVNGEGYVYKTTFHQQSYYPQWIDSDKMQFIGTRLPDNNTVDNDTYTLHSYDWGYADNMPNNSSGAQFDIDWAVDTNRKKVHLDGIDFVKIYTGVNQFNGRIGESSTEVSGVIDLHLLQQQ